MELEYEYGMPARTVICPVCTFVEGQIALTRPQDIRAAFAKLVDILAERGVLTAPDIIKITGTTTAKNAKFSK